MALNTAVTTMESPHTSWYEADDFSIGMNIETSTALIDTSWNATDYPYNSSVGAYNETVITLIDTLWNATDNPYNFSIAEHNETSPNATACNVTRYGHCHNPHNHARSISRYYPIIVAEMVISCLCLAFSLLVYRTLPEFRNVHGRNLTSMSACLLVTFSMLILDLIVRGLIPFSACYAIAMVIHFTFLGTFFWTLVMAFDIWRSLADMKARKGEASSASSRKFLKYSLCAWSATLLTALPAAVLESTSLVGREYRPQFGVRRCWLSSKTAFIYYFNLPVGVILFTNLVLFLLTIRKLLIIKKMTAVLNVRQQQQRLFLYLKLFLVMGITWVTEFIPWVSGIYSLYALAGMLTALHGIALFLIFVCKKKILRHFWQRLREGRLTGGSSSGGSSQQTDSSASNNNNNRKQSLDKLADSKF